MNKIIVLFFSLFILGNSFAQREHKAFIPLVGKTWKAQGTWKDGTKFKQEITYEFSLDTMVVITKTKGYTNPEQTKFGPRNYGLRKYNRESGQTDFWEFDLFGGLTHGTVSCENRNFIYNYEYGGANLTEEWEYVNDSTYNFYVGIMKNGEWTDLMLSTQFLSYDPIPTIDNHPYSIVIHGGAGTITRKNMTPEKEKEIRSALNEAISLGYNMLENGKTAIEVVEAVVVYMEDSPLFNAGRGAVFNSEGHQEMDACIMDGTNLSSGAVTGVQHLKNPIIGARLVKDSTRHVMLSGTKAEEFCLSKGAVYADSSYFFVQSRWDYLQKAQEEERNKAGKNDGGAAYMDEGSLKYGTVGCVVVDKWGNVAAATSTGGLTNKKYGRIGDSPIVGAGTYANNLSCAVSCTGTGEYFIRGTIARDIAALMEYKGLSLQAAGEETLSKLNEMGGDGGFIGVDKNGNVMLLFNTEGMYRAYRTHMDKAAVVKIYGDE